MSTANAATRRRRTSERRDDILRASLACFLRHGIEQATIEQIRNASGASSGSIYHHFRSKQGIAVALYVDGMRELGRAFRAAMDRRLDLRGGLRAILRSYFQWVAENRDWALYLLRVSTADLAAEDAAAIDEVNRTMRANLADWLRPFAERGEIVDLPDDLLASMVYGASTHYARHWLVGRLQLELADAVEFLADAAWKGLAARFDELKPPAEEPAQQSSRSEAS